MNRDRAVADTALARHYGLGGSRLRLLSDGENTTFRVDADGGPFVLRVQRSTGSPWHPVRTDDMVRSELAWLTALRGDTDLAVPEPVPADGGEPMVSVDGRTCLLLRWMPGRFLDAGLRPVHLERVGRFTALLHEHAAGFRPPPGFVRHQVAEVSPEVTANAVAVVGERDAATVVAVLDRAAAARDDLGDDRDRYGLVHADLHHENYLFRPGGEPAVIDFDDCGWGHHLYDLAVTVSELQHLPDRERLRAALLRGYRSVRPLPDEQERHLDTFAALRCLLLAITFAEEKALPNTVRGLLDLLAEWLRGRMPW